MDNNQKLLIPVVKHYYVEHTPQGEFRKEMTKDEYEKFKELKTGQERKAFMNPNNEVTE